MKPREIEDALLLRDSGELSDAELVALESALLNNPELAALAEENRILQEAGPFSSAEVVPPLSELGREKILQAAEKPQQRKMPRLLAVAALLVLGLGLLPHLSNYLTTTPPPMTTQVEPVRKELDASDPMLNTLEMLESELALWSGVDMSDPAFLENESDWAVTLLSLEDAI